MPRAWAGPRRFEDEVIRSGEAAGFGERLTVWEPGCGHGVDSAQTERCRNVRCRPLEKTAECARAIQGTVDPHRRTVLTNLQKLWIALANQRDFLTEEQVADQAEKIGRLQVELN